MAEDAAARSADASMLATQQTNQIRQRGEDALLGGITGGIDRYQKNKQLNIENQRADVQANLAQRADSRDQVMADRQQQMHDKYGDRKAESEIAQAEAGAKTQTAQAKVAENQAAESQSEREFMDSVDETHPNKVSRRQSSLERRQKKEQVDQQIQQAQLELSKTQNVTERQRIGLAIAELEMNKKKFAKDSETADLNNALTRGSIASNRSAAETAAIAATLQTVGPNGQDRVKTAQELANDPEFMKLDPVLRAKAMKQARMDFSQMRLVAMADPTNARVINNTIDLQQKAETVANVLAKMRAARNQFKNSWVNNASDDQAKATFVQALRDIKKDNLADDIETGKIFANLKGGETISEAMDRAIKSLSDQTKDELGRGNAEIGDQGVADKIKALDNDYMDFGENKNPFMNRKTMIGQDPNSLEGNGINPAAVKQKTGAVGTDRTPLSQPQIQGGFAPGMKPRNIQTGAK
jgi:hypothetical protein